MKKALLIIDVQNDYFPNGKCQLSDGRMWEVLTARYFSAICLPDCTVMHVTA